jgi:predicted flavoprotein YhiN
LSGVAHNPRVAVVGAGASGTVAAIALARKGCEVKLLEGDSRVGKKILATGNGRCNLSNTAIGGDGSTHATHGAAPAGAAIESGAGVAAAHGDASAGGTGAAAVKLAAGSSFYNAPEFVSHTIGEYSCEEVRAFFKDLGLLTFADSEGRVYPVTNAASSVLDVLRNECRRLGVAEFTGFKVEEISAAPAKPPQPRRGGGADVSCLEHESKCILQNARIVCAACI